MNSIVRPIRCRFITREGYIETTDYSLYIAKCIVGDLTMTIPSKRGSDVCFLNIVLAKYVKSLKRFIWWNILDHHTCLLSILSTNHFEENQTIVDTTIDEGEEKIFILIKFTNIILQFSLPVKL